MPDLPNRRAHEERFAYGLAAELTRQRRALVAYGVENLPNRPAVEWERDKEELAAILLMMLRDPWFTSHYGLANEFGVALRPDELERRFQAWAKGYATTTAGQMVDNTREASLAAALLILASREPVFTPSTTGGTAVATRPAPVTYQQANLFDVADTKRIVRGSISMVTDATSAGEQAVADAFDERETLRAQRERITAGDGNQTVAPKQTLVAYWHKERDGNVCKICRPLHGQPESVWGARFPSGPKAHVACRCYLDWRIE